MTACGCDSFWAIQRFDLVQKLWGCGVNEVIKEILAFAEGDAKWFDDAARKFEQFAAKLNEEEKAELELLATVYRERAQAVQCVAEKVRQSLATDDSSASH